MPINAMCPKCGKTLSIPPTLAGKAVRCPCGQAVQLSASAGARHRHPCANPLGGLFHRKT